MGVKEPHASPGIEVLEDEIAKQGALAKTSLPDDIQVLRPVLGREQDELRIVRNPERAGTDADRSLVHGRKGARPLFPSRLGASVLPGGRNLKAVCLEASWSRPHQGLVTERARQERWAREKVWC